MLSLLSGYRNHVICNIFGKALHGCITWAYTGLSCLGMRKIFITHPVTILSMSTFLPNHMHILCTISITISHKIVYSFSNILVWETKFQWVISSQWQSEIARFICSSVRNSVRLPTWHHYFYYCKLQWPTCLKNINKEKCNIPKYM